MQNDLRHHGTPWKPDHLVCAAVTLARGMPLHEIAAHLGRKPSAVEEALARIRVYVTDRTRTRGYDRVYMWRSGSPLLALKYLRARLSLERGETYPVLEGTIALLEFEQTETKEKTMNDNTTQAVRDSSKLFEQVALCKGRDVRTLSDEALLGIIAETEGQIAKFQSTTAKPKRLERKVAELKAQLKELVDYLDGTDKE